MKKLSVDQIKGAAARIGQFAQENKRTLQAVAAVPAVAVALAPAACGGVAPLPFTHSEYVTAGDTACYEEAGGWDPLAYADTYTADYNGARFTCVSPLYNDSWYSNYYNNYQIDGLLWRS